MENLYDLAQETSRQLKKYFPKIKHPKEVELMDKLNEQNREEYKRWLFKKRLTDKLLGKKTFPEGCAA